MEGHLFQVARFVLVTLCLAAKGVLPAAAQEYEGWSPQRFADSAARLQQLPPEERFLQLSELVTRYTLDQAWAISGHQAAREQAKPEIRVHKTSLPIHVNGNTLSVPVSFYPQMSMLAILVGHDAAVSEGKEIPVSSPLLFKPFAEGRLMGLFPDLGGLFENDGFLETAGMAFMAVCGPQAPACQQAQGIAILCVAVFVVGHEVTHVRERHEARKGGAYPIAEELLADARALRILQRFVRNLESSGQLSGDAAKKACFATPVAFFEANSRRSLDTQTKANYLRRKEALLEALGSIKDDVESLVALQTDTSGVGSIAVSWSSAPSLVAVDGIAVSPAEVDRLVLLTGRHRLVAASSSGVAAVDFRVSHQRITRLHVELQPVRQVSSAELSGLVGRKQWGDVLAATGNAELRPRNAGVSIAHWEALRGLRMGAWIDPKDLAKVGSSESRRARVWRSTGQPLTSWDDGLPDSID